MRKQQRKNCPFAFLQEFDLEIVHIPGEENEIADVLSRNGQGGDKSLEEKRIAMIRDDKEGIDTSKWIDNKKGAKGGRVTARSSTRRPG